MEEAAKGRPLIVLTGPTAVGKTGLSIALAKAVNGEILSADSMQVYRHMDIGSAKITREEMQGVPHHLIDVLEPWEDFNVVVFQKKCEECLSEIYERGRLPILVGGTGFYIQAVLRDIDFTDNEGDAAYRETLEGIAAREGAGALHEMLLSVDPASAKAIHPNNVKRTIRALEYYELTGERISEHNGRERQKESPYNACYFVLNDERDRVYARIGERVDAMMEKGLLEEVKRLRDMGVKRGMVSMQGLGYKELLDYLDGACTLEEAVFRIKRDTRRFAKRQLTWFRREPDAVWLDRQLFDDSDEKLLAYMLELLKKRGIFSSPGGTETR